jgi:hypothetical protein
LNVFTYIKWGHLSTFLLILLNKALKSYGYHSLSQLNSSAFIGAGYFYVIPYVIYTVKYNLDSWHTDMNWVRCWLLIESIFFFNWVFMSIAFIQMIYWLKLNPFFTDEEKLLSDEDVWNDKNSYDILRFMKNEYFNTTYIMTMLYTDIVIGYTNLFMINEFGPR